MRNLLAIIVLFCAVACVAQDVIDINGVLCNMHGSSRVGTMDYKMNVYKSRYRFPRKKDFDTTITLQRLAKSDDPNAFSFDKAVILRGYVFNVKTGGVETCNCKSKDADFKDTHIELTMGKDAISPEFRVIAEVTPRLRLMMKQKGVDWSTGTLKKTIRGRYVELAGWLFYDVEHETEAYANDPDNVIGRKNWRASCWEVHPITYIKILDNAPSSNIEVMAQEEREQGTTVQDQKGSAGNTKWIAALIIAAAVIILLLIFRK